MRYLSAASEAKQSSFRFGIESWIASSQVLLAMTEEGVSSAQ